MSFAPDYNPTKDFSQAEANNEAGRSTVSTSALDTELANLASSINSLNTNLKLLQRDDGQVKDFTVGTYALSNQLRALISVGGSIPRGPWVTATDYAISDLVSSSGIAYICHTAHTSGASFDATKFIDISGDGSAAVSAANAAASANAAGISEAAAAVSAAAALVSQGAAATSASAASTSAAAASTSETTASSAASSATASAGQASASAAAAIAAQAAAELATLPGRLIDVQIFSTAGSHTWTKPSGLTASAKVEIEMLGGGASGAGAAPSTAGNTAMGGGGGAGAYCHAICLASLLAATETVTVGDGGAAKTNGAGNDGGATRFSWVGAQYAIANPGSGGGTLGNGSSHAVVDGGAGGAPTFSGAWTDMGSITGSSGGKGVRLSGASYIPSSGSSSPLGDGGMGSLANGSNSTGFGSGSSGSVNTNGSSGATSGTARPGIAIIRTYS